MKTRRGNTVLASDFAKQTATFEPGDLVTSVITGSVDFVGHVVSVDPRLRKISVNWGDGLSVQHDPDEIQHVPHFLVEKMEAKNKMASRRGLFAKQDMDVPAGDMFVGDPKTHGIDQPRGGGFSIMQQLQKDLHKEMEEEADEGPIVSPIQGSSRRCRSAAVVKTMTTTWNDDGSIIESTDIEWDPEDAAEGLKTASDETAGEVPGVPDGTGPHGRRVRKRTGPCPFDEADVEASDHSGLKSRRAMYWMDKGRTYRLTKNEQGQGNCTCPRCREQMEKQKFTRNEKLFSCPGCGFKIPSSKVVRERKVEVEVSPDGSVEVEIEPAENEQ